MGPGELSIRLLLFVALTQGKNGTQAERSGSNMWTILQRYATISSDGGLCTVVFCLRPLLTIVNHC